MKSQTDNIDIKESKLRRTRKLLDILLCDRTTGKNIIWGTDSYEKYGKSFAQKKQITPSFVTGRYGKLIQPRAAKSLDEQRQRTKNKAEVFTSLKVVDKINKNGEAFGDRQPPSKKNWQGYVRELRLEITCGEAPFIASRYNPMANTGKLIKLERRVGFLDRKLRVVSRYCDDKKEWLFWAIEAFKASYGYEWQGDNVLLARENLLYTLIDYYEAKFVQTPSTKVREEFAEIISWNIFQMDGLKYVIPMSCHPEKHETQGRLEIFVNTDNEVAEETCFGCKQELPFKHNGVYVTIMDWVNGKEVRFVDVASRQHYAGTKRT